MNFFLDLFFKTYKIRVDELYFLDVFLKINFLRHTMPILSLL